MIGFVVPSIGRPTISSTLKSLLNQTNGDWKCYVGFDGKSESDIDQSILTEDPRINYLYYPNKLGVEDGFHGNAGRVRNEIIKNIDSNIEWIGFVDDDDTLSKYYVELLSLELTKNDFDCCVFRMRYDESNERVLPPIGSDLLIQNFVGISFCVNKKFIMDNKISFMNDNAEDFMFLKEIGDKGGKIRVSPHITYNVNGHSYGQK